MKMPSINIAFKEKGISAVERSERGIVLLILKEETLPSQTEVNLYTADDIPKELSDSNREQLELTLRGYVNSPKKVIAEIISKDAEDYTDVLKAIENKRFDYLVIPDIEENHIDTIAIRYGLRPAGTAASSNSATCHTHEAATPRSRIMVLTTRTDPYCVSANSTVAISLFTGNEPAGHQA